MVQKIRNMYFLWLSLCHFWWSNFRVKWKDRRCDRSRNCVTIKGEEKHKVQPWAFQRSLPPFQPFTSSYIAAPLETPDGSIQLTRNRRRSMVGIHIIASLVVGEPRHKHKGLFVSGLPILEASHCYLTVCGRGGGQARTGAAMSSKPGLSQAAHHCIGTPAPQRLLTKNQREVKIEESRRHWWWGKGNAIMQNSPP